MLEIRPGDSQHVMAEIDALGLARARREQNQHAARAGAKIDHPIERARPCKLKQGILDGFIRIVQ